MNFLWSSPQPSHSPKEVPESCMEVYLTERPVAAITDGTFGTRHVDLKNQWEEAQKGDAKVEKEGKALVRVLFVSVEPAMRGWLNKRSYVRPVQINEKMRALGVGVVVDTTGPQSVRIRRGTIVSGIFGWCDYCIMSFRSLNPHTLKQFPKGVAVTSVLGGLGTTGMTAYFGLLHIGKLQKGETVVVSAAAGATGSIAAQIAKHVYNCFVVGIAGGKEKCDYLLTDLGLDAAIDYKNTDTTIDQALRKALNGRRVHVFFDNVGGSILEAVLRQLHLGARIIICGGISQYNQKVPPPGPRNYLQLISSRASMTGFLLYDFEDQFPTAFKHLAQWFGSGKLTAREDVVDGLSNAPAALQRLFEGKNIGKVIVRLSDDADALTGRAPFSKI